MKKSDIFYICKKKDIFRELGVVSGYGKSQVGGKLVEKSWRESKEILGIKFYFISFKYFCGWWLQI